MVVAFCCNIKEFRNDRILDYQYSLLFPGASWIAQLKTTLNKLGHAVHTGDVVLNKIKENELKANEVLVIQELNARDARKLIKKGAKPFLLTGFESPLFAWHFYDRLRNMAPKFKNRILFNGAFQFFESNLGKNYALTFPNFEGHKMTPNIDWDLRKFMVMVAANKSLKLSMRIQTIEDIIRLPYVLGIKICRYFSKTFNTNKDKQLHDKRLYLLEYFGGQGNLDVYGAGWDDRNILSKNQERRLRPLLNRMQPYKCTHKIDTMSYYKFAICFENVEFNGYLTEKMIDCFVAGVIPIYMGAPDIHKIIPENIFIDMRKFHTIKELDNYLKALGKNEANAMIEAGKEFLKGIHSGGRFSFKSFSDFVTDLVLSEETCNVYK